MMREEDHPGAGTTYLIGELAAACGVSTHAVRVWERRFNLLTPRRTSGGYRVYDEEDLETVRRMIAYRDAGHAAAEAARLARAGAQSTEVTDRGGVVEEIWQALVLLDRGAALALLTGLASSLPDESTVDRLVADVILPLIRRTGVAWQNGDITSAQSTFACQVVRAFLSGRLADLERRDGAGHSAGLDAGLTDPHQDHTPVAWLACPPGERHDLVVLSFAVLLDVRGWRVRFFGGGCPVEDLLVLARRTRPDVVVLGVQRGSVLHRWSAKIGELSGVVPTAIGGGGARADVAAVVGAILLSGDVVTEADALASRLTTDGPPRVSQG